MKKIAASFASSDGCTPMPPTPNHRRAPFTGGAEEHGHQRETDDGEAGPDEHRLAVVPVVDPHHDRHHRQAEHRPHRLLGQERVRLAEALQGHRRRRAVDHDDAQRDQQQGRDEQHLSDLSFLAIAYLKSNGPLRLAARKALPRPSASATTPNRTSVVSGQQSSAGSGLRHQLPRPGQPGFPAASPPPREPTDDCSPLTTAGLKPALLCLDRRRLALRCRPPTFLLELSSAIRVIAEHVEAGAGGREQHDA